MNIQFQTGVTTDLGVDRAAKQARNGSASTLQGASGDRATLSTAGKTVSGLVQSALSTPATRQDRIDAIRSSINAGTYQVDHVKIAGSILSEYAQ